MSGAPIGARWSATASGMVAAWAAAAAVAQSEPPERELERVDQPPAPWSPPVYGPSAAQGMGRSFPFTTQANVGPGGQNIIGDAANEPSMAVDPAAPLRIVVGWRQFDSVTSNFRQAGYALSRTAGGPGRRSRSSHPGCSAAILSCGPPRTAPSITTASRCREARTPAIRSARPTGASRGRRRSPRAAGTRRGSRWTRRRARGTATCTRRGVRTLRAAPENSRDRRTAGRRTWCRPRQACRTSERLRWGPTGRFNTSASTTP